MRRVRSKSMGRGLSVDREHAFYRAAGTRDATVGERRRPFAPHFAEELWQRLGHHRTLAYEPWPAWRHEYLVQDNSEIPVQVNGKLRGKVIVPTGSTQEQIVAAAQADAAVAQHLAGKALRKQIYIPGRLLNLVVG